MRFFPQTLGGATAQFPIHRRRVRRTVVNEAPDGRRILLPDDAASAIEWRLVYEGLSDPEAVALRQFFVDSEGRRESFTFLDPTDNLLEWSEELDRPVWQRNALLQLASGVGDPLGTQRASRLTNASVGPLGLEQVVNAPENYFYGLSVYARSSSGSRISLYRRGASTDLATYVTKPEWRRFTLSGRLSGAGESLRFGVQVEPGEAVEIFGAQAEAQPGASGYMKTTSRAGVYPNARFAEDELEIVAQGVNWNSCRVAIVAPA